MLAGTSLGEGDFITVDIEATGCRPGTNSIIEIGAVHIQAGAIVARFGELVRPNEPIPQAIRHLTGIDDDMVSDAADIGAVMRRFREFVGDSVLVAHNHRFDLGFLDYEAERTWGMPFPRPVLDTLALARRLRPGLERYNLRALSQQYGVETVPDHRATTDAMATAEVWCAMILELAERGIHTAGDVARFCGLAYQGDLARKLVIATHLPDTPGVYVMRDAEGRVLHIGRAKSLRTRVRSFFYAPVGPETSHPAVLTDTVSHVVCASALDAQLLESRLSLRYHPLLDRDHERGRSVVYLHVDTSSAYPRIRVTERRYATGTTIGPLTNAWAAETLAEALRMHFGLRRCNRRLDSRAAYRACAHRSNGGCPRPCEGVIPQADYRDRLDAALLALDGDGARFRSSLQMLRETCAAEQRYEDAIFYRDALRALDRTMSALSVIDEASATPGLVLIEGDDRTLVLHIVRYGYLAHTLRIPRADLDSDEWELRLQRVISRVFSAEAPDPARDTLTPRQLRDIFLIHTYRQQSAPSEVRFAGDVEDFTRKAVASSRRFMRVPHTRHAGA